MSDYFYARVSALDQNLDLVEKLNAKGTRLVSLKEASFYNRLREHRAKMGKL